jgi:glycosyltransferase involved in cell wall biosynthesis
VNVLFAEMALLRCPGGAERFAFELMAALGRRHGVRALVMGEPGAVGAIASHAPEVEAIAKPAPGGSGGHGWPDRLRRSQRVRELVAELLAHDAPDAVISHLDAGAGALAAARAAGVPSVLLLAGYDTLCRHAATGAAGCRPESRCRDCPRMLDLAPAERAAMLKLRARHDAALAAASCVVAPSRAVAAACRRISGRGAAVAAPVTGAPAPALADPRGRVVLVSSQWTRQKGVELLAPIASRLAERPVLVRAPNGLPGDARRALARLGNVTVDGSASGIGPLLDGAAAVLVPAQAPEPFGRVAFEALAAGVPTLASATGGLPEFVPPEQLVRESGDPDAWAAAVRALDHPGEWDAARRRGLAAARRVLATDPAGRIERELERIVREPAVIA